ncbi:YncE family protein [Fimbriiglobus ruber]|uniref:Surface antigen n=1 Tax=Fimbriiglobus ruber TaxID=1908690 RepID=A0A225E5N2_9BACT|nr:YncE family protein [Fimbriiglobus ruber]OWK47084.1 surface antigen [Fimbriiglobus ruber]
MDRRTFLAASLTLPLAATARAEARVSRFLYVVCPGIRDYLEFGGAGILVFDIDDGHKFVKRIATDASKVGKPRNIKGVVANAATRKLHFTTPESLYCVDLLTEKTDWGTELPKGCDRVASTPDGKMLYVPSFEKDIWNVVETATGKVVTDIETKSGSHNTICGLDGKKVYLAGLKSPFLSIADTKTNKVVEKVGPFAAAIRPFTVNGSQTLCFVNVNELLGFEIGDLKTGKKLHRVEVPEFKQGPVKRHGCPSHGIGLTPDEREVWVVDGFNERVHVFDTTAMPPTWTRSIKLREQPGWVTFSLDGKYAYPSTGEVIDTTTKKIVTALSDEKGGPVHSEKMVEIHFKDGVPVATGDQFGLGRKV